MLSKEKTMEAIEIMYEMFPNAECELKHKNPFELLIAVILSAQATDVSKRLRICKLNANVTEVEQTLMRKVPKELWVKTHHTMIFFGRYHCLARAPKCEACPLLYMCQEGKERMKGK